MSATLAPPAVETVPAPPPVREPRRVTLLRRAPLVAAVLAGGAALLVLVVGWGMGLRAVRTLTTASAQVRPLTALCLLLLAISLLLQVRQAHGDARVPHGLGPALAVFVVFVALASFAQYVSTVDLHIDRLLFPDEVLTAGGPNPGRMPPESASGVLLVAIGQSLLGRRERAAVLVSQLAALASGALGLTLLYASVYRAVGLESAEPSRLPVASALCYVVLAIGVLAARPEGGLARIMTGDSVGAAVGRRLLTAALTVPFVLGWVPILFAHALGSTQYGVGLLVTGNAVSFGVASFVAVNVAGRWETESLTAQAAAAESHRQLLALIDNTSAVIYMRDLNGRYMLINREYERLFDVNRDDVIGKTDHDLFPAAVADAFRENDLAAIARGRPVSMEEITPGDELGPHTYITVKFPILDSRGEPYAVCGISTDITARQRAEAEVRRLNEDLETRIFERTAELEASTRELDAFAYSVSHDLRAPLRSLDGFSQVLAEDYAEVLDDAGKDYLRRIQHNAIRMGQMIDDLLNLSRTTRLELKRQLVDLTGIAEDVVAELREGAPDREVTVHIAHRMQSTGDPHLLRLALMNLISNAWKFTGKRADARIEVGRGAGPEGAYYYIKDNGAGFDMAQAHKLFDPFNRLHSRNDFDGSGLGLAIVQRIIRRHGGRIWATAAVGEGATFHFTLTGATGAAGNNDVNAKPTATGTD